MAWTDAVDIYCERLGPGLWAEPLNALSNLGFVLAGAWLLHRATQRGEPQSVRVLSMLLLLIGLGSATFHTVATRWAEVLDVLFIGLFIYWFVACYLRHVWEAPWWIALLGMLGFYGFSQALSSQFEPGAFNGSVSYLPALAGLLIFGLLSGVKAGWRQARWLLSAAFVFAVSLVLRTLDMPWCQTWPPGTHWAWHLLNALTLGLTIRAISHSPGVRRLIL